MIAKCVALLAIVAQINGYVCNTGCGNTIVSAGNGAVAYGAAGISSTAVTGSNTRNYVARGKYPVALENPGPVPDCRVPVTSSQVTAPVQEKPTVRLSANIPAPRTVAHSCTCYKTIMRPRVHDQLITVPSIQRYIETTHSPVVENIHYEAVPVNSPESCVSTGVSGVSGISGISGVSGISGIQYGTGLAGISGVSGLQVGSGISSLQYSPVSFSSGLQVAPVSSYQVAPVAVSSGVVPVGTYTTGVQGCAC